LVASARTNAYELFARFRLNATAKRGADGFSFVRASDARNFTQEVGAAITPLLPASNARLVLPDNVYFSGPLLLENWSNFDKREVLSFEGWETQTDAMTRKLYMELRDIDANREFPSALRIPAANLYRLLAREKPGSANEFSTIKELKSPR